MGITFLLTRNGKINSIDVCRGTPGNDSLKNLNDKLSNKGQASDVIKISTLLSTYCVGGGEDPPIGGIPYTPPPLNATMLRALVDTDT